MNKKQLCTLATIAYHMLFLGGTTTLVGGYLEEINKLRQEIVKQADRADAIVKESKESVDKLTESVEKVTKVIRKAEKACKNISF